MQQLGHHVERAHSCRARLERIETIVELDDGALLFDRDVHVFALAGHPTATHAYAWESSEPDGDVTVVLGGASVRSARDAVLTVLERPPDA